MKPIISIIVPVYNVEKVLGRCINSLISQTLKNIEIILVNDGSPDNSGLICDKYAKSDIRIKVFHIVNSGVSFARNYGIDRAAGKYILFCDSDDWVESNWCEKLYNAISLNDNSTVICGYVIDSIKNNNDRNKYIILDKKLCQIERRNFYYLYKSEFINNPVNKIFIKKILFENNIRFNNALSLGEDLLFNLEYIEHTSGNFIIINEPLYHYIKTEKESLTNKYYEDFIEIQNLLHNNVLKNIKKYKSDTPENIKSFYSDYFYIIYNHLQQVMEHEKNRSFIRKIHYNNRILNSKEFNEIIKYADFSSYKHIFLILLKIKSYLLIYIFNFVLRIKKYLLVRLL